MIGEVPVAGKTVQEATKAIRQRLEARFMKDPQVNLTVIDYAKKMFTILGQVQRPGTYRFPDRESINLIQAIGIAGGYTPIGDPARITLKRVVNGNPSVLKLDAKRMARDNTVPLEIQSGDIVTVGERLF
jgi:polysaccharide export outer membrane protein